MRLTFVQIQRVVAIPTTLCLLLATTDLPAQGVPSPAAEGSQAQGATQQLTRTCQFNRGPRTGKSITFLAAAPVPVGSSCTDGVSSTGSAVADNPHPQLTHACQFDQGPRSGQTQTYPQVIQVGASCWDGVSSAGVSVPDGSSDPYSSPVPLQNTSAPAAQQSSNEPGSQDYSTQQRCDALAGSPSDPSAIGAGVNFEKIDTASALVACQASVASFPGQPRFLYEYGRALEAAKRYPEAVQEFSQAAGMGYSAAMNQLAELYFWGEGVQQSDTDAAAWFGKAAALGNASAMFGLGAMYQSGRGVPKSDSDAVAWYRKGAEAGNPDAMTILGQMLRAGLGTQWNEPEAMTWFQKAANLGNAQAEMQLGMGYMNGLGGGRQDYELAGLWLSKAAQQGNDWAQLNLAILYQNGWGVTQDITTAKAYYGYAAKGDDPQVVQFATARLQDLNKQSSDGVVIGVVAGAALLAIIAAASSSSDHGGSSGAKNSSHGINMDSPGPGQKGNWLHDYQCSGKVLGTRGPYADDMGYSCN